MIKVLVVTEFSNLCSGYAIYGRELLKRLSQVPGIEVAELAKWCYQDRAEHRLPHHSYDNVPWKVYPVVPPQGTEQRHHYEMNPHWKFGAGVFNDVLLDFQPTHVVEFADTWMAEYQFRSPLRNFFSHIIMPAIDASNQHKTWINMYSSADKVLGYTNWGLDMLKDAGLTNLHKAASPCAAEEFREFSREDKNKLKASLGLGDIKIIGTVMRNQGRKLFPELFHDFRVLLERTGRTDLYLLCHTSSPDTYSMDELIIEHQVGHRTLFVYSCQNPECNGIEVAFWHGEKAFCNRCGQPSSGLTSTSSGISTESLCTIYNLMDLYVQYAQNEGYGIPLVEAIACGVPIAAVDYSAMSEILHEAVGRKIAVKTMKREADTGRLFALPDKESFIQNVLEFFDKEEKDRIQEAQLSKICYGMRTWNDVANIWLEAIVATRPRLPWNAPQQRFSLPNQIPQNLTNSEFARFLICDVLNEPERLGTHFESRLIRDLNNGYTIRGFENRYFFEDVAGRPNSIVPFNREAAFNHFRSLLQEKAEWDQKRLMVVR